MMMATWGERCIGIRWIDGLNFGVRNFEFGVIVRLIKITSVHLLLSPTSCAMQLEM